MERTRRLAFRHGIPPSLVVSPPTLHFTPPAEYPPSRHPLLCRRPLPPFTYRLHATSWVQIRLTTFVAFHPPTHPSTLSPPPPSLPSTTTLTPILPPCPPPPLPALSSLNPHIILPISPLCAYQPSQIALNAKKIKKITYQSVRHCEDAAGGGGAQGCDEQEGCEDGGTLREREKKEGAPTHSRGRPLLITSIVTAGCDAARTMMEQPRPEWGRCFQGGSRK